MTPTLEKTPKRPKLAPPKIQINSDDDEMDDLEIVALLNADDEGGAKIEVNIQSYQ